MTQENSKEEGVPEKEDIGSNQLISSEPEVIGKLRKMGFKFGMIDSHLSKPEDRNLI